MKRKANAKQYTVRLKCTVTKIVVCEGCTAEQAEADPFAYAVSEREVDQSDWDFLSITEDD